MDTWIFSPIVVATFLGLIVSPIVTPLGGLIVFLVVLYLLVCPVKH